VGNNRIKEFISKSHELGIDLAVISPGPNLRYFVGLNIETFERFGALLICVNTSDYSLVLPRLDEGKARATGLPYSVYGDEEGPLHAIDNFVRECTGIKRVGFEGRSSINYLWIMRKAIGDFEDVPIDDILTLMRISKDEEELSNIEHAVKAIEEGIRAARESIRPGIMEVDIAKLISDAISSNGADPKDILVQSGPNSAIPHWVPSRRRIERGDVVVVDVTATYNDYYGDLTRTMVVGEPPSDFWRVYDIVHRAHDEAIKAVKDGVTGVFVDSVARRVITNGGYGNYFIHRTGHGIGLEVHEEPYISQSYTKPLPRGSVFTIEPGIYLPGRFGVRLESDVAILKDGNVKVLDSYWPEVVINA